MAFDPDAFLAHMSASQPPAQNGPISDPNGFNPDMFLESLKTEEKQTAGDTTWHNTPLGAYGRLLMGLSPNDPISQIKAVQTAIPGVPTKLDEEGRVLILDKENKWRLADPEGPDLGEIPHILAKYGPETVGMTYGSLGAGALAAPTGPGAIAAAIGGAGAGSALATELKGQVAKGLGVPLTQGEIGEEALVSGIGAAAGEGIFRAGTAVLKPVVKAGWEKAGEIIANRYPSISDMDRVILGKKSDVIKDKLVKWGLTGEGALNQEEQIALLSSGKNLDSDLTHLNNEMKISTVKNLQLTLKRRALEDNAHLEPEAQVALNQIRSWEDTYFLDDLKLSHLYQQKMAQATDPRQVMIEYGLAKNALDNQSQPVIQSLLENGYNDLKNGLYGSDELKKLGGIGKVINEYDNWLNAARSSREDLEIPELTKQVKDLYPEANLSDSQRVNLLGKLNLVKDTLLAHNSLRTGAVKEQGEIPITETMLNNHSWGQGPSWLGENARLAAARPARYEFKNTVGGGGKIFPLREYLSNDPFRTNTPLNTSLIVDNIPNPLEASKYLKDTYKSFFDPVLEHIDAVKGLLDRGVISPRWQAGLNDSIEYVAAHQNAMEQAFNKVDKLLTKPNSYIRNPKDLAESMGTLIREVSAGLQYGGVIDANGKALDIANLPNYFQTLWNQEVGQKIAAPYLRSTMPLLSGRSKYANAFEIEVRSKIGELTSSVISHTYNTVLEKQGPEKALSSLRGLLDELKDNWVLGTERGPFGSEAVVKDIYSMYALGSALSKDTIEALKNKEAEKTLQTITATGSFGALIAGGHFIKDLGIPGLGTGAEIYGGVKIFDQLLKFANRKYNERTVENIAKNGMDWVYSDLMRGKFQGAIANIVGAQYWGRVEFLTKMPVELFNKTYGLEVTAKQLPQAAKLIAGKEMWAETQRYLTKKEQKASGDLQGAIPTIQDATVIKNVWNNVNPPVNAQQYYMSKYSRTLQSKGIRPGQVNNVRQSYQQEVQPPAQPGVSPVGKK